jgi:hypothetical protein
MGETYDGHQGCIISAVGGHHWERVGDVPNFEQLSAGTATMACLHCPATRPAGIFDVMTTSLVKVEVGGVERKGCI